MAHPMFEKHQPLLENAVRAVRQRGYWSPYAENPGAYGENAVEAGRQAFSAYFDAQFYLDQPGVFGRVATETSPYGLALDIAYPQCGPDALIAAAKAAMPAWIKAGPDARVGVCLEMLARLNAQSAEIAHALMHTTGQSFAMAFLHGGPQAQSRGLEAVAQAWQQMRQVPERALWEKPQAKNGALAIDKCYTIVPRGVALLLGNSTAPTWNAYPALFASLATGNPVIVKPHAASVLPLAISVAVARQTLKEAGFDANLVSLLVDEPGTAVAKEAATKAEVRLIDYAGPADFGAWLDDNARQARLYSEQTGVNCVVIESTDDYKGMLRNLAVSLSLYSGQNALSPQTLLVSSEGVRTPEGTYAADQFGRDLSLAVSALLEEPARACEVLGAIQDPATLARIEALRELAAEAGELLRDSSPLVHPQWPEARVHTPMLLKAEMADRRLFMEECRGPVAFVVETATASESLAVAERIMRERGALLFAAYTTNPVMQQLAEDAALRAGVALSLNLTGGLYLDQSHAFSDFHGGGVNPAGSACLVDGAFVAGRFHIVQTRRPAA